MFKSITHANGLQNENDYNDEICGTNTMYDYRQLIQGQDQNYNFDDENAQTTESKERSQPGGSLYFGLKNQQERRMADHNGSTDVSTTLLHGVLDTNHHVFHAKL